MQKTLAQASLPGLIAEWMERAEVHAPVRQGDLTQFQLLQDPAQAELIGTINTRFPPKALFLPQSEVMFRVGANRFHSTEAEVGPRVILGVRPCDARALQLLDTVFAVQDMPDPYWVKKREQTTIVALGCDNPCETCFCTTVGSGPFDGRGADALLTKIDGSFVVTALSEKGRALCESLPDASSEQQMAAQTVQTVAADKMQKPFNPQGIRDKLYGLFESDFWQDTQQSCLGCGVCTFLCPTCYCFDIVDETQRGERVRNWDTCMFRIYSQEASGHNPRPTKTERTRQRIMHKYAYWPDLVSEIGCTGCGRCVRYCPVDLDIRHIIRSAQARKEA
jgi:sulfhydrogenase subunit beta (sulfur reductase)